MVVHVYNDLILVKHGLFNENLKNKSIWDLSDTIMYRPYILKINPLQVLYA